MSGTRAAVIEANTKLTDAGESPVKFFNSKKSALKNDQVQIEIDERDYGLGDKEWHILTVSELLDDLETDIDQGNFHISPLKTTSFYADITSFSHIPSRAFY